MKDFFKLRELMEASRPRRTITTPSGRVATLKKVKTPKGKYNSNSTVYIDREQIELYDVLDNGKKTGGIVAVKFSSDGAEHTSNGSAEEIKQVLKKSKYKESKFPRGFSLDFESGPIWSDVSMYIEKFPPRSVMSKSAFDDHIEDWDAEHFEDGIPNDAHDVFRHLRSEVEFDIYNFHIEEHD